MGWVKPCLVQIILSGGKNLRWGMLHKQVVIWIRCDDSSIRVTHGLPKDFVLLVLLCGWLVAGPFKHRRSFEIIDFFSGKGRISRLAAKAKFSVAAYEILHDLTVSKRRRRNRRFPRRSFMDINGEAGIVFFGTNSASFFGLHFLWYDSSIPPQHSPKSVVRLLPPRLAVILLLQAPFGALVTFLGPVCSSWVAINAGTSQRTLLTPGGNGGFPSVQRSNKMACRMGFPNGCRVRFVLYNL